MALPSVFMADLTNNEVEAYLENNDTVLVPTGSTEQHGPHAPLSTDVLLPTEVARRVAEMRGCLVAPSVPYGLSGAHRGFKGLVYLQVPTYVALIGDIVFTLAEAGFRNIIFINGHYTNTPAINMACLNVHPQLPEGTKAWAVSYWDAMPPDELNAYLSLEAGLHANIGETSCVMALRPELVHLERSVPEWPDFSNLDAPIAPIIFAYFETRPASMYETFEQGTWGDPRESTAERGIEYFEQASRAVNRMIDDVNQAYAQLNVRKS